MLFVVLFTMPEYIVAVITAMGIQMLFMLNYGFR